VFTRFTIADWLVVAGSVLGLTAWGVRLEARVDAEAAQHREAIEQVRQDLTYIRTRLDQVLDGRTH